MRGLNVLLRVPTAINLLVAIPILQLHWERYYAHGPKNTAQGEILPFTLILFISTPMAALLLLGWAVLLIVRLWRQRDPQEKQPRSVIALAIANILAPLALLVALALLS